MRIVRTTLLGLAGLGAAGWLSASLMAGGQTIGQAGASHRMPMAGKGNMMTKDQKIAEAMTAAPASVSATATIVDWPAREGARHAQGVRLRRLRCRGVAVLNPFSA